MDQPWPEEDLACLASHRGHTEAGVGHELEELDYCCPWVPSRGDGEDATLYEED